MNLYEVLRRPIISEKNTEIQLPQNKYTFEVTREANKYQIKQAVEKAFNVIVLDINVIKVPAKTRRVGRRQIKTSPWKKAVVTLRKGDKIEFFEGV